MIDMFCLYGLETSGRVVSGWTKFILFLLVVVIFLATGCIFQGPQAPSVFDATLGLWAGYGEDDETLRFFLFPGNTYMIFSLSDTAVTYGEAGNYSVSRSQFYLAPSIWFTAEGDTSLPDERGVPYIISQGKLDIELEGRAWEVYRCNRDLNPVAHWKILGSWSLTDVPNGWGSIRAFFCRGEYYQIMEEDGRFVRLDAGRFSFDGYQLRLEVTMSSDEITRGEYTDLSAFFWHNMMELEEERDGFVSVTQWVVYG